MPLNWSRREFINLLESMASIGILQSVAPALALAVKDQPSHLSILAQATQVPNTNPSDTTTTNSAALQMLHDVINTQMQNQASAASANALSSYSGYNGPEIHANYGPTFPMTETEQYEYELEGATREDFPSDYMNFDPQTGMFQDVDYWEF